jgi:small subunit ribosomal protein S21
MNHHKSKGTGVSVREGENINVSLRRFKRKVEEAGTLDTLRKKEFYEKPTTARKRAKGAAKARWRKKLEKDSLPPKLY